MQLYIVLLILCGQAVNASVLDGLASLFGLQLNPVNNEKGVQCQQCGLTNLAPLCVDGLNMSSITGLDLIRLQPRNVTDCKLCTKISGRLAAVGLVSNMLIGSGNGPLPDVVLRGCYTTIIPPFDSLIRNATLPLNLTSAMPNIPGLSLVFDKDEPPQIILCNTTDCNK